jgi:hypothetical protein
MTDWGQSDATAGEVVSIAGAAYVFYDAEVRNGGSLSWCNCNPGNIVTSGEAESYNAYQGAHNYRFAVFPDEDTGQQAIRRFLRNPIRASKSILDMMRLYAPDGDGPNSAEGYANSIAGDLGVSVDTSVSDLSDDPSNDQLGTMSQSIKRIEGWQEGSASGPDNLPDELSTWLSAHPEHDDRQQADQPYADIKAPPSPGLANLQNLLNTAGADPALTADGKFGPATRTAVIAFQQGQGLGADGIAGTGTWQALLAATGG